MIILYFRFASSDLRYWHQKYLLCNAKRKENGIILKLYFNNIQINVRVGTPASTVEFAIDSSATGKQLFDQVINTMCIKEIWYFGLDYTDSTGFSNWVKFNKKLTKQGIKKDSQGFLNFSLCVRYYPEDVSMLNDNSTLVSLNFLKIF